MRNVVNREGVALYLFGSALTTLEPNDLDLCLVYDPARLPVHEALYLRRNLSLAINDDFSTAADIVLLSEAEAEQSDFVKLEGAIRVSFDGEGT